MTHPNFRLQKVKHTLAKVNALANEMRGMSDEDLKHQTVLLKKELANGKTVDDILPSPSAPIREASFHP